MPPFQSLTALEVYCATGAPYYSCTCRDETTGEYPERPKQELIFPIMLQILKVEFICGSKITTTTGAALARTGVITILSLLGVVQTLYTLRWMLSLGDSSEMAGQYNSHA